jgi:hypothetical protein
MFPAAANDRADRRDSVVTAVGRGLVRPARFPRRGESERSAGDAGELVR